MRNKKLISKLSNWLDWMTFEGHQTWHFLKQIMQSEEFPYLLSTHLLKQVWVILNGKNNKRLAKWIIMQTKILIKQIQSDSTLYLLTTAGKPTCWIIRPYIPSPFQPFQISAKKVFWIFRTKIYDWSLIRGFCAT